MHWTLEIGRAVESFISAERRVQKQGLVRQNEESPFLLTVPVVSTTLLPSMPLHSIPFHTAG